MCISNQVRLSGVTPCQVLTNHNRANDNTTSSPSVHRATSAARDVELCQYGRGGSFVQDVSVPASVYHQPAHEYLAFSNI